MKRLLTGLFVLSSLQIVNAASTDTIKAVREKIVEIHIKRAELPTVETKKNRLFQRKNLGTGYSVCSGAVVTSQGDILTARHCTEDAVEIRAVFSDGREYKVSVVAQSQKHDLALIHADRFDTPFFRIASSIVQGQRIYVMGSPLGLTATLSEGIVAKRDGDLDFLDATVLPGNSGGPAFNEEGDLVGITTAGFVVLFGFSHLNIMQSVDAIRGFGLELQSVAGH